MDWEKVHSKLTGKMIPPQFENEPDLVLHSHWGVEAIVVDYIRPSLFGGSTVIPNLAQALVWALSAFTLGALYYFNYTDIGLVNAIKMLWKL